MEVLGAAEAGVDPAGFELVIGTTRVLPSAVEILSGGIIAQLSGAGLLKVLDATFGGQGPVDVWAIGDVGPQFAAPRAMRVTEITMRGATTLVTLEETGRVAVLN